MKRTANFGSRSAVLFDFVSYAATTPIHKASSLLAIGLLGLGLGVGLSIATSNAKAVADAASALNREVFNDWQVDLTTKFSRAIALSATMGGFAMSYATTPMNWTLADPAMGFPPSARMIVNNDDAFVRLCQQVFLPGVTALGVAPGGVTSQYYPIGSLTPGTDLLQVPVYKDVFVTLLTTGEATTSGPNKFASRPGFGIVAWFPIFTSSTNRSRHTFWGTGFAVLEMHELLTSTNVDQLVTKHNLDYVVWFTAPESPQPTVLASSDATMNSVVMSDGLQTEIPIGQANRHMYVAVYPRGGYLSPTMKASMAGLVVFVVVLLTALVVLFVYCVAFSRFLLRHRHAPRDGTTMYVAALTLRGAQPMAERAPLEAVRMFADFTAHVRLLAARHGCYPVAEMGDRTVLVVAKTPGPLLHLAKSTVTDISIQGCITAAVPHHDQPSHAGDNQTVSCSVSRAPSCRRSQSRATRQTATNADHETVESSFIGSAVCRPSAAVHAATAHGAYDAQRDLYFFGNALQLGKLCAALDGTKGGEVGWTQAVEDDDCCGAGCRMIEGSSVSCHIVSEGANVVLHVASLWKETGDERDDEDPSVAMAALADSYLKRMTAVVSDGRSAMRERKHKGKGDESSSKTGSSEKSADATAITRNATLLHICVLGSDGRMPLDIIRRVVADNKGAVVSAHGSVIVAAFNLLAPGGHHQVRAADTVMRLRAALPNTPFVCSIHHGKVNALIVDGLVMCSGEAVVMGKTLLDKAVEAAAAVVARTSDAGNEDASAVVPFSDEADGSCIHNDVYASVQKEQALHRGSSLLGLDCTLERDANGLCLLLSQSELSTAYECEAVDVMATSLKPRVVYRLAFSKCGQVKAADDEWMYQLKDEEDCSPFASVNAVFAKVASGAPAGECDVLWRALIRPLGADRSSRPAIGGADQDLLNVIGGKPSGGACASVYARVAVARLVPSLQSAVLE